MNKEIELLNKKIEAQDKIINTQALEIAKLKEQLENDIDRYEDTISYQLGFDKGKEQLQQENKQLKEDKKEAVKYINRTQMPEGYKKVLLEILGDKEND